MAIVLNRFDGGEVDFLSARDLGGNQFQKMRNMRGDRITRATKTDAVTSMSNNRTNSLILPGQGWMQFRAEWNNLATPTQTSTLYGVAAVIVDSAGAWEINIARRNALVAGAWETEFIDETSAKGGWERATSNRLVQGASNITFTASTDRISGHANLANYEVGEVIRVMNTTSNNGYYTVKTKEPAANSVDVHEPLTDEASVSAYLYPLPIISMFAINGNLRVSNGNFVDSHASQWYGHIKRDFWGQGITYGSNGGRFEQPVMTEAYNAWKLQDQELVAPTIIAGDRTKQATSAANQIAVHIAGTHPADWPDKAADVEWNPGDRVAFTYVYDFVQESELSRASNGEIGLPMGTIVTSDDARAFMVEVYTGAAQASWNRRRTAIRMYYQFYDDPDWYEVVTLDVNKGWSESEIIFDDENTGYWIPMVDANGMDHIGTTDGAGGSGTTINDVGHGVNTTDVLYVYETSTIEPESLITKPSAVAANTITLPVAAVDSLGVNPANYNSLDWCTGDESSTALGTFYIPFTGEKSFTYFTNTGRSAKLKVPAIRWAASDTDGSKVLYGNIDTTDDNAQTIRERTRVIETPEGMPDVALLSKSKDVGNYSGDEIVSIKYYNRAWWVIMERSVVVLQPGTLRELARYNGVGSKWSHANTLTPFGLCVADQSGVTLLPSGKELSFKRRDSYQLLTFFQKTTGPTLSYSIKKRCIYFMPNPGDEDNDSVVLWRYSFDTEAWGREDLSTAEDNIYANPVSIGRYGLAVTHSMADNEPEYLYEDITTQNVKPKQINIGTGSGTEAELKTKEYDNGQPQNKKIYRNGYLSYTTASSGLTVKVYLDSNATPAKTMPFGATSNSMTTVQVPLNVTCNLLSLSFVSSDGNFEIEEFIIPDGEITVLDR